MNKKLMAVAVAGALTAPAAAFAQASNVQIYGTFDVSYNQINHKAFTTFSTGAANGGVTKGEVYNQSSRMGIRGTEDLGNGLKAWFQAESNIAADGRQFNNTAGLGSRNTGVGLQGSWGQVLLGNWDSPYKAAEGVWNNSNVGGYVGHQNAIMHNNDSTGSNPNLNCNNVVTAGSATVAPICGQLEAATTSFSNRMSNTVQYWTPTISGFTGRVAVRVNEEKNTNTVAGATIGSNNPSMWAGSVNWAGGPAAASFAYESHTGWRDAGVTAAAGAATAGLTTPNNVKDNAYTLGGTYDFKVVQIAAAYERMKFGNAAAAGAENNFTRKNWFLGAAIPVGNGAVRLGYSYTPGPKSCGVGLTVVGAAASTCLGDTKAKLWTIGYEHNLSKRTALYASYSSLDNGSNSAINFSTPVLNATSVAGGAGTGQDITVIGAGIRHSF